MNISVLSTLGETKQGTGEQKERGMSQRRGGNGGWEKVMEGEEWGGVGRGEAM